MRRALLDRLQVTGCVEFCETVLGVVFTPAQRIVMRVIDGEDPVDMGPEDRELCRELFGNVDRFPVEARDVVVLLCGRGSGKSYLIALRLVYLALTTPVELRPGEHAYIVIASSKMSTSRAIFRFARGALKTLASTDDDDYDPNDEDAKALEWLADGADSFVIRRPDDDVIVEFIRIAASKGGDTGRSMTTIAVGLDEFCLTKTGEEFEGTDRELFEGVKPRVLTQILMGSTPWGENGLLLEKFNSNWGSPSDAIALRGRTELMRPSMTAKVARERRHDAKFAAREYDCEMTSSGSTKLHDPGAIDRAILPRIHEVRHRPHGSIGFAGLDVGFRRDHSSLVVAHLHNGIVEVAEVLELARGAQPLVPYEVAVAFADVLKRHRIDAVLSDLVYFESTKENLAPFGIRVYLPSLAKDAKQLRHFAVRDAINEERVLLYQCPALYRQLKALVATPGQAGHVKIDTPRKGGAGGHGDTAEAATLAIAAALQAMKPVRTRRILTAAPPA